VEKIGKNKKKNSSRKVQAKGKEVVVPLRNRLSDSISGKVAEA